MKFQTKPESTKQPYGNIRVRLKKRGNGETFIPDFSLIVDNREQAPFRFSGIPATAKEGGGYVVPRLITDRALATGDYSIDGMEAECCIERKSLADLFGSVGREHQRFEREFERMAAMKFSAVVVEADEYQLIHNPPRHSKLDPRIVLSTVEAWAVRYPTKWFFCASRHDAEIRTYRLLARCYKEFGPNG